MVYSTGKSWTRIVAERDAGIDVSRSLEATEPEELTAEVLNAGVVGGAAEGQSEESSRSATPSAGAGGGFARPKRPGRR